MTIIDRYIIFFFARIFVICLVSFAGLYVVVDAFTNLEEFLDLGAAQLLATTIPAYYGPRVLLFFDRTAPILALVAAVFCLAIMQRNNELTAIQAGGVSGRRIVRPVLVITAAVVFAAIMNRELVLPRFRNQLVMNAQDLSLGKGRPIGVMMDQETGILIRGQEVFPAAQQITLPEFTLPGDGEGPGTAISAQSGIWYPGTSYRPAGFVLDDPLGDAREVRADIHSKDGRLLVAVPSGTNRLRPNQLLVATQVDAVRLTFATQLARNASLGEMIAGNREGRAGYSRQSRVSIHWRIVQPLFDMTVLLIGLPLVMSRGERNLFLSAGLGIGIVSLMSMVVIASHALGAARILNPPALAAWLPLFVFVPVAWVAYGRLR